jgi:Multimeric flavodoxin WrbA
MYKITVINGTEIKGCTWHIKEAFLDTVRGSAEITEFYLPRDMKNFCCGCKNCFYKGEDRCPHTVQVTPIWQAMLDADLIVFAYPVYALRTPGQVKALLDHLCCHWFAHRPDARMFSKRAAILTQSVGAPNGSAQKDVATSLRWMGVSDIKTLGFGLMEGVIWDELTQSRRDKMLKSVKKFAAKYKLPKTAKMNISVRCIFGFCKSIHKNLANNEQVLSTDNKHWVDRGWIKHKPKNKT